MKGYSFRSLTDLVLKIFKTRVIAGTGLSGGGSLEADRTLTVKYGTTAGTATQGNDSRVVNAASNATVNAKEAALEAKKADKAITITAGTGLSGGGTLAANRTLNVSYGTAAGTAAQGNDNRLSNSREWASETISQAETEAGTATTRRAFTAQRVRQAIVAWFNGISGTIGRTILGRSTSAQVRGDLGLGTAATRNVGESARQVMEVGAFGIGANKDLRHTVYTTGTPADLYGKGYVIGFTAGSMLSPPVSQLGGYGTLEVKVPYHHLTGMTSYSRSYTSYGRVFIQQAVDANTWGPWRELIHTGNLTTTTGQSTLHPMTQKAVTDALITKANIINSVQTSGDQTIAGIKTFSSYPLTPYDRPPTASEHVANKRYVDDTVVGSAIGVGQTWQDVMRSRVAGTTYTNTTRKPIMVAVSTVSTSESSVRAVEFLVDGVVIYKIGATTSASKGDIWAVVPSGSTYKVKLSGAISMSVWAELR